ncbi:DNA (cytosine-5-)-methyltransferase [Sphingopyxis sp. MC1]|uniref:DNA (cytosine-5-)-methyltransferase n=1 Tax=Sphingopyxis sp. MC1 TaxID=1174684 RepID=UPI0002D164FF|nr:DNA (cytosine-5-)-methyltransferase [Sphingopyxis sp. MC1]ENY82810.1 DNA-cytosine methyltransferase [Sphingopyxis sp. MC1]MBN2973547.1 DNA (cytosine-5-)-methyltransferase [Roseomonas aeriglobus]
MTEFRELRERAGLSIAEAIALTGYAESTVYRWESGRALPRPGIIELLRTKVRKNERRSAAFTFVDLFAGIGGLRRGFEKAGGECVFTSEWDAYSQKTYRANYPDDDHEIAGDIREVSASDIPDHDLLLAGFPCQPFSLAGVSKKNALGRPHGFRCDAQGTLFFDVARIIEERRPRAFVLENVKNLVSHDGGRTFRIIHHTLQEELKYRVKAKVINARSLVPQHRERIFIVGFREDTDFSFDDLELPAIDRGPRLGSILHPGDGSETADSHFTEGPLAKVSSRYTLTEHLWSYLQGYAEKHRERGNGFGFGLVGPTDVARTLSARYYKDGSEILVRQPGRKPPRRLTPRECARLMGFDEPDGSDFKIPVSDTQAYKQFGNAVVVPVVERVADLVTPWLTGEARQRTLRMRFG